MDENVILKLFNLYKDVLGIQINRDNFIQGNLINDFNIDSLIALQLISEIEKKFNIIIEDDDLAIKLIDSPNYFYKYYQQYRLKYIYEKVLNRHIDEDEIDKDNLIKNLNIDLQQELMIITEIEKCFQFHFNKHINRSEIVDYPLSFLNTFLEVNKI